MGDLFAILVVGGELRDEAGHDGDGADDCGVGALGHEALDPDIEGALELEAPQGRVAVEDGVVGEDGAGVGGAEDVGEAFADLLGQDVVEDGRAGPPSAISPG